MALYGAVKLSSMREPQVVLISFVQKLSFTARRLPSRGPRCFPSWYRLAESPACSLAVSADTVTNMLSSASDLRLLSVVSRTEEGQRDLATSLEWSSSTERGGSMASPLLSLSSDLQTKFPVEAAVTLTGGATRSR